MTYSELATRAQAKGIKTFGQAVKALDADARDIWPYDRPKLSTRLYNCQGAVMVLECLAEDGQI